MNRQTSLRFPVRFENGRLGQVGGPSSREPTNQEVMDSARSGAFFLLGANPGELVMKGSVGVGATGQLFKAPEDVAMFLPEDILLQFRQYTQRARVDSIEFRRDTDGVLLVDVGVSATSSGSSADATVSVRLT